MPGPRGSRGKRGGEAERMDGPQDGAAVGALGNAAPRNWPAPEPPGQQPRRAGQKVLGPPGSHREEVPLPFQAPFKPFPASFLPPLCIHLRIQWF